MIRTIATILFLMLVNTSSAQNDTLAPPKKGMNGLGLTFGYGYGILHMESKAMFIPNSDRVITASSGNAGGATAGLFYEYRKNQFSIRPAVETAIIFAYVEYDVQKKDLEEGWIFPFTIDVPVHFMYHFKNKHIPSIVAGPRAIIPMSGFNGTQPPQAGFGFNVEAGISYPLKFRFNTMRIEAGYSLGLNNLLVKEDGNEYTGVLDFVKRDLFTVKLYFN